MYPETSLIQKIKNNIKNGGAVVDEYRDYILIKELYHCKPSELDSEDDRVLDLHFQIMQMEKKEEYLKIKRAQQKSK